MNGNALLSRAGPNVHCMTPINRTAGQVGVLKHNVWICSANRMSSCRSRVLSIWYPMSRLSKQRLAQLVWPCWKVTNIFLSPPVYIAKCWATFWEVWWWKVQAGPENRMMFCLKYKSSKQVHTNIFKSYSCNQSSKNFRILGFRIWDILWRNPEVLLRL